MKFKSDIEVQAGLKDSAGSSGNGGSILSSTSTGVTWIDNYADWTSVLKQTVKNDGVAVIPKGAPVYITGSDGTNMLVGLAGNATEATSSKTLGLMQTQLATSGSTSTGFVVTEGLLQGLNTAGRTAGEPIWLGPNGTLIYGLTNKPYAPAHLVFIGIVTKISSGNGEVFVKVQNGFELKEIHDVDIVTDVPINGDILGYNGTLWVNKTIAEWLGFTPANDASVVHLSGTETITGQKTFTTGRTIFQNSDAAQITFKNTSDLTKTLNIGHGSNGNIFSSTGLDFRVGGLTSSALLILANENATFKENLTAKSFIKSGGTSSQFLKADGSIDSTTYQTALTNPVTGTGTTNYIPKFTGASAIGNSLIYDDGIGFVGIGTTTPLGNSTNKVLKIEASSSANILVTQTGGASGGLTSYNNELNLSTSTNHPLWFGTSGTERMRITSGGNVGIGTTSPSTKLDVNGDINSGATIYSNSFNFRSDNFKTSAATVGKFSTLNQGATDFELIFNRSANGSGAYYSIQSVEQGVAYRNLLFQKDGGNVGIGTTSPVRKLDIISTEGQLRLAYDTSGSTFSDFRSDSAGGLLINTSANYIIHYIGGSERMRITSDGNVGIGTTSPAYKLDAFLTTGTGSQVVGRFLGGTNSNGNAGGITLGTTQTQAGYVFGEQTASNEGSLVFGTQTSGSYAERMRITSGGNVGIGTTSPLSVGGGWRSLNIDGTKAGLILSNSGLNPSYIYTNGTGGVDLVIENSGSQIFNAGTTERMRITSGGNVGIGTNSPNYTTSGRNVVDINGSSQSMLALSVGGVGKSFLFYTGTDLLVSNESNGAIKFNTNGSEKAIITSSGNVGIGTTSPINYTNKTNLAIQGAWGGQLDIMVGSTSHAQFGSDNYDSGLSARIQSADGIVFKVNGGTLAATITSDGNVGIGTTSPSEKLVVANGKLFLTEADPTIGGKIYGYNDTSTQLYEGGLKFQSRYYDGSNYVFADRLTIKGNGNVGIGTTADSGDRVNVNGSLRARALNMVGDYNASISTNSGWSSFQTLVPIGTLNAYSTYLISVWHTSYGGGQPYEVACSFMYTAARTNGGGVDNEFTPIVATHTGGTGAIMTFRSRSGAGSISGLEVKFTNFNVPTGTIFVRATKIQGF